MSYKPLTEENCTKDIFPNLNYSEFKCKCKYYCDGYPVPFSYDLAVNLQKIRTKFNSPLYITSALRCEQHNIDVGGTPNSKHKKGTAVDFYVKGVSYSDLISYCKTLPYYNYSYRISNIQDVIHYDINPPSWNSKITEPLQRDTSQNQLKIIKKVHVRTSTGINSSILGEVNSGNIYNWAKTEEKDNYTWYEIDTNQWVAQDKDGTYLEILPKEEDEKMIEELQKQLDIANKKIEELNQKIKESETNTAKFKYKVKQDATYEIKLLKDEELRIY